MGQKVNPISNRLGIVRGWDSNWYGGSNYGDTLLEDSKIRNYLNVRLPKATVSRIVIERTIKLLTITICITSKHIIPYKAREVNIAVAECDGFVKKIFIVSSENIHGVITRRCYNLCHFINKC